MAEEKLEAVTVHVPPEMAAWLKGEAVRTERSVSFVVRKAVHTVQRMRDLDAAESITHVTIPHPDAA